MDHILRAVAADGMIKMQVISARSAVQEAQNIHRTSPTATAALGRTLMAASLCGDMMKEENASVTLRINGGGPIGSIVAVSDSHGNMRGYVDDPTVELPLRSDGKLDVGGAVGRSGMLTVSRDIGLKEPYISSTELVSGEIAEDFTRFLLESEQVPSACGLGVLIDTDCSVKAAGGFLVQLMPGAADDLIEKLEDNIFMMDQLTTILSEDGEEALFAQVLKGLDYHMVGSDPVAYLCPCSRERVEDAIRCIDEKDLTSLAAEGISEEVLCQFCGKKYIFTPEDLNRLLNEKAADA